MANSYRRVNVCAASFTNKQGQYYGICACLLISMAGIGQRGTVSITEVPVVRCYIRRLRREMDNIGFTRGRYTDVDRFWIIGQYFYDCEWIERLAASSGHTGLKCHSVDTGIRI